MHSTTTRELLAYWSRVRGNRDVPNRRDIAPTDLGRHLPDIFILEQTEHAGPIFRLAGTRICAHFGRELRTTPFPRLFAPEQWLQVARICAESMSKRAPTTIGANAQGNTDETAPVEIVLLPMTSHTGHADRVLGALCPIGPVSALDVPFRYMTMKTVNKLDRDVAYPPPEGIIDIPLPTPVATVRKHEFSEVVKRVLHLRVYDGGK